MLVSVFVPRGTLFSGLWVCGVGKVEDLVGLEGVALDTPLSTFPFSFSTMVYIKP